MKNQYQGIASLYLLHETDLDEEEFNRKLDPSNIIAGKLHLTDCNGKVHIFDVMEVLELVKSIFENNKIATECQLSDQ
jgi:hypothetical protein